MYEFFKSFVADDAIFYCLLLLLIGTISFGLGRLTILAERPENSEIVANVTGVTSDPQVVVSKNGTKYHYLWCAGAAQMKEENKLYFPNEEAAKEAGYSLAANCPSL